MKTKRHALILELISNRDIDTQEELTKALAESGVQVTQATVSRDIKELRLVKTLTDKGTYKYTVPEKGSKGSEDRFLRIFTETVLSVAGAGNIVVLKTITASAQTTGEAIDNLKWPEIIGTIAGDNTVLAIVQNIEDVDDVVARFKKLMGGAD